MMKIVFDIYIFLLKFKSLKKTIFLFIFLLSNILISQSEKKELIVKYTDNEIIVDGILDEPDWNQTRGASNFYEHFPDHGSKSKNQAVIKVMNDDSFIYIGIKVFGSMKNLKTDSF